MAFISSHFDIETRGENAAVNITKHILDFVRGSKISEGMLTAFVQSTTASIMICEDEPGLISDILEAAKRIAPKNIEYKHNLAWHDDNGRSHVKATLFGQSVTIPIKDSTLHLGTWQSIFLFEFDVRPRKRAIIVSIIS